ncbi:HAD family hydrolase [Leifsonia poae]|uniref:Haloacid dehalogenase n=1 Tax=Leifsonia poae TaxID=110933 RepID=A0A9W6LZP6_9MICO|nr:HAD family hydrolase [Leifsonia poae]GLJ76110.1 haloacid dehalogenase [Leifsonia poae]
MTADDRLLIALDVDGTLIHEDETVGPAVLQAVGRMRDAGHEVMLATGRSWETARPIHERFGLTSEFVVCANGALTMQRDETVEGGYRREFVEVFDPTEVLETIRPFLPRGSFMVEDATGFRRYTEGMTDWELVNATQVSFEELAAQPATRVVVVSPQHDEEQFLSIVEQMGLHKVSYAIGWTAWLDIAPDGVNKATAMERVRQQLGIPFDRLVAVGDGRNDIDLLQWAGAEGRAVAMGQAPDEVKAAATVVTLPVDEDGLAAFLDTL